MQRVIIYLCFMLAQISPALAQSSPVNKPDIKVGDRWKYQVTNIYNNQVTSKFEQKITNVNGDEIKLDQTTFSSPEDSAGRVASRDANRATWTFPDRRIFEGSYVFLDFPLEVGKTWKNEYQRNRNEGGGTTAFSSPVKVEGWEEVEVPAGKFKALKVVHSGFYNSKTNTGAWTGRSEETVWYSPDVKKFVKSVYLDPGGDQRRTELVEYEVK